MGWLDDVSFVIWENGLAECLTYVTSFEDAFHLGGDSDEEKECEQVFAVVEGFGC